MKEHSSNFECTISDVDLQIFYTYTPSPLIAPEKHKFNPLLDSIMITGLYLCSKESDILDFFLEHTESDLIDAVATILEKIGA